MTDDGKHEIATRPAVATKSERTTKDTKHTKVNHEWHEYK
jgi:hypothetical protein